MLIAFSILHVSFLTLFYNDAYRVFQSAVLLVYTQEILTCQNTF